MLCLHFLKHDFHLDFNNLVFPQDLTTLHATLPYIRFLTRDLDLKSPTYKVSRWS